MQEIAVNQPKIYRLYPIVQRVKICRLYPTVQRVNIYRLYPTVQSQDLQAIPYCTESRIQDELVKVNANIAKDI